MSRRAVLAIDVGSSSVRAGIVDVDAEVSEAAAQRHYEQRKTKEGASEADPEDLIDLIAACIDEALAELPGGVELIAVATSTYWHSLTGVDSAGRPTIPIHSWADRRSASEAVALREELDEEAVHARTGCVLHSSYPPAKLRWLAREQPDVVARTVRWLSPGEFALLRFCGEARVGHSMASGTGLLDLHADDWDPEMLAAAGIDADHLSPLSDAPLDGLHGEWAERWPALARLPWFPAVGDGATSNAGCGALSPRVAALMIGTSAALRVAWRADEVSVPPGLWCYRVDPKRFITGAALSNGGNNIAWLRDTLQLPEPEETERALAAMAPDAHGLTMLPLLAGERAPGWADDAHGSITGLSLATQPLDILRATLEGVALRFALIDRILDASVAGDHEILATGGGLRHSPTWTQIICDALGRPIRPSLVKEASTRGVVLLALEALGEIDAVEDLPAPAGDPIEPDPERHAIYREAMERQQALYAGTVAV